MIADTVYRSFGAWKVSELSFSAMSVCFDYAKDPYKAADVCRNVFSNHGSIVGCSNVLAGGAYILGTACMAVGIGVSIDTLYRAFQDLKNDGRQERAPSVWNRLVQLKNKVL